MEKYLINSNAGDKDEHEVHVYSCSYLPDAENQIYLGEFDNCEDAVSKAKSKYPSWIVDGCGHCCEPCHEL